jgi:hypothetical protein
MAEEKKYRAFELVRDIAQTELRHFTAALRQAQKEAAAKPESEAGETQSELSNPMRSK